MQKFWIGGDENICLDDFIATAQLTIQNGIGSVWLEKFGKNLFFYHLRIAFEHLTSYFFILRRANNNNKTNNYNNIANIFNIYK